MAQGGVATNEELTTALAFALDAGALDSAALLAERLASALPSLRGAAGSRARALVVQELVMRGARAPAIEVARHDLAGLSASVDGVSLLELLEIGEPRLWLPDGRLNLLACSRRGTWSAEELASVLESRTRLWLRQPELSLLFFSLLPEQERASKLGFLNRFLALHGLPGCSAFSEPDGAGGMLSRLRFASSSLRSGPLVSVIMPAYNSAGTLGYAVDSLLAQNYGALELLVGDDASDDETAELLRARYAGDSRVRLFRSSERQGAYNLRNALAKRARGELLAFHDADDLALPTRLATQVARLRTRGVEACASSWLRIAPNGRCVFFRNQKATRLCRASLLIKKRTFEAVGPFRSAKIGADLELFARLRATCGDGALSRIAAPLVFGLWSEASVTRAAGTEALESGYRSPSRRLYSELVFAQHAAGFPRRADEEVNELLRSSDNYAEPSELVEVR